MRIRSRLVSLRLQEVVRHCSNCDTGLHHLIVVVAAAVANDSAVVVAAANDSVVVVDVDADVAVG